MKYKQLAEEREKALLASFDEIGILKRQLALYESEFDGQAGSTLESEEAREILRLFASKAGSREELALLVRALSKLPA